MDTLDKAYTQTIKLLNSQKIDYLVIGGLAVGMLGEARMTQDVDILIAIDKTNIEYFLNKARKMGYKFDKKLINNDLDLKGAFRLLYSFFHIDFIVGSMPFEKEAFKRSLKLKLYNHTARFPTPEDLILFKIIPGREKDILDVKSIILRNKDTLDLKYLTKWAQIISDDLENMDVWNRLKKLLENI